MRSPRLGHRSAPHGLTVVELMIVVLVIGVIAGLAVPMFRERDDLALRSAAMILAADLDAARVASIANADDPRVVVFDTDAETYFIAAASDPATPLTNPADRQPWRVTFGQGPARELAGVGLRSVAVGGDSTLGYAAFGNLDETTDATVELEAGPMRLTISIDAPTGEATVGSIVRP